MKHTVCSIYFSTDLLHIPVLHTLTKLLDLKGEMAGKSNKGRGKRGSHNSSNSSNPSEAAVLSDVPVKDNTAGSLEPAEAEAADVSAADESLSANSKAKEHETANSDSQQKQGEAGYINIFLFNVFHMKDC